MHNEDVSVIVPVYNGAEYLAGALASILRQDYKASEIIVVDDGSTDTTPNIIRNFSRSVRSVRQDNSGPAGARNTGIRAASHQFIAFLDSDDVWRPSALRDQLAELKKRPDTGIAWGLSVRHVSPEVRPPNDDWHGLPQWALSVQSMLFKRAVFDRAGFFDPEMRVGEDFDFLLRITEQCIPIARHANIVCDHNIHSKSITADQALCDRARFIAIKKAFERRRSKRPL